jgi:hypothetical protein
MLLTFIHEQVKFFAKKASRGFISPEQVDGALDQAQLTLFMKRLGNPNEYARGQAIPRMGLWVSKKIQDDLRQFVTPLATIQLTVDGVYQLPADYVGFNAMVVDGGTVRDTTADKLANILNSQIEPPTKTNPVIVEMGNAIQVYPNDATGLKFSYLRLPKKPKLGYEPTGNGRGIVVNEEYSTDIEWPKMLVNELIMGTLNLLAIPVKDNYVQQVSEMKQQQGV